MESFLLNEERTSFNLEDVQKFNISFQRVRLVQKSPQFEVKTAQTDFKKWSTYVP